MGTNFQKQQGHNAKNLCWFNFFQVFASFNKVLSLESVIKWVHNVVCPFLSKDCFGSRSFAVLRRFLGRRIYCTQPPAWPATYSKALVCPVTSKFFSGLNEWSNPCFPKFHASYSRSTIYKTFCFNVNKPASGHSHKTRYLPVVSLGLAILRYRI